MKKLGYIFLQKFETLVIIESNDICLKGWGQWVYIKKIAPILVIYVYLYYIIICQPQVEKR